MYGRVHIYAPLNTTRTWTRVEQVCSTRFVSSKQIFWYERHYFCYVRALFYIGKKTHGE